MTRAPCSAGFDSGVARRVWETKYRLRIRDGAETGIEDTWHRVAAAVAGAEDTDRDVWRNEFGALLAGFKFLPGGRILANAGTTRRATLFNCFVMGTVEDSIDGIFDALKDGAVTLHYGGGVGFDFSTLRPRGARAAATNGRASGPVSFLGLWDQACATLLSTGNRRGAMMGVLRCDHPDIVEFIDAKREPGALTNFNLSVLVTDEFLSAVDRDDDWPLVFPAGRLADASADAGVVERDWPGEHGRVACSVAHRIRARALWERIARSAFERAEPGVLFIDRINREHNLGYIEKISATNPCGELPLPPFGACCLGSLNLTRYVRDAFTPGAYLDENALTDDARSATRFLDNVIDVSRFPLEAQREQAARARRVGLGITGLADTLIMLGIRYETDEACETAAGWMRSISRSAYRASATLAREKGAFADFERESFLACPFVRGLPSKLRDAIAQDGIRNGQLLAIAPAGTVSLLAGGVSSGIEPVFESDYDRAITGNDGKPVVVGCTDYACRLWRNAAEDEHGGNGLPPAYVDAYAVPPERQLAMLDALQRHVDGAISKTVSVPASASYSDFASVLDRARSLGVKGFTAFRPNPVTGAVLNPRDEGPNAPHCCHPDREMD